MSTFLFDHSVVIRPMKVDDLEQVHQIDILSFSLPWPPSSFRFELLENPAARCWVAEVELPDKTRQVTGMVVTWLVVDEAHIATIAVHPGYRSKGLGRRLLREAMQDSISAGAKTATLEVRAHNEVAQNLYRDFGFDVVARRPHYYSDNGEDALLMKINDLDQEYLDWLNDDDERWTDES